MTQILLNINFEFIAKELNNVIIHGSTYDFISESIQNFRKIHIGRTNSGPQMASDMISHLSYRRKYGDRETFFTSIAVENIISQSTGQAFDIISNNYLTDGFGVQLKHVNTDKTLGSFKTWESELLEKSELYKHHISVSLYNPNLNDLADILDYNKWSYNIIGDDITPDEVKDVFWEREKLIDNNNEILNELRKQANDKKT